MTGTRRIRVVAVMTHPVQYLAPWFRHIHAHASELDFTVVYATAPGAAQQGVGFGAAFQWDVPLRDGYDSIVIRKMSAGESLDSDRFFGIDVPEVVDVVRALQPDVALIGGWHSATQVRALVGLRRAGVPVLYRGDTHLGSISRRWPAVSRLRARVMLRQFSGYLAVGTRSREYLLAMGAPDPAIVSSPHAIDNEAFRARAADARTRRGALRARFGFDAAHRVVLFAGKLTAIKQPADVIQAVERVPNGVALFVGDGVEREHLESESRARGVRAVFTGFANQSQMTDHYVTADALLLPGRETWGLVANEALAAGLPVVLSSEVGASADLSSPGVCVTVPSRDHAGFARALTEVIDRHRTVDSTRDCEAAAARFSFDRATQGLVTAARFAVSNSRGASSTAPARIVALSGNLVFAGGMERISYEALAALRRGGADVHALLNGWSSRPIARLAEVNDISWEVGHYDAPLDGVLRDPRRLLRACLDILRASGHLSRLMVRRRLTHVFAVDFRAVLLHAPALLACRWLGIPVLLRSGVAPTPTKFHRVLWQLAIRPLVTRHVANSDFTASELAAAGIPAARIVTIRNVAPRRSAPVGLVPRERHRVAYVGQVIAEKGVLQLLEAIGILVARGLDVRLDIAGQMDGWAPDAVQAYRKAVRARADREDLAGRVAFLGWREDVDAVLRRATVHCCPSQLDQREGFGITVVEAKRAGIPSVVCPSGALPELIEHGVNGWISRGFDADALAEGLDWLLSDEARLAAAQRSAAESVSRFDLATFARCWQDEFGLLTRGDHVDSLIAPLTLVERN
jgi:glycosyltransferase involved in cell wall biosynthesis